jgi:hypothetical protein
MTNFLVALEANKGPQGSLPQPPVLTPEQLAEQELTRAGRPGMFR